MSTIIPPYSTPPIGTRPRRIIPGTDDFTRRDPSNGPYGVFIEYTNEAVSACRPVDIHLYRPFWRKASPHITKILWGSQNEQEGAKVSLQKLNHEINSKNCTRFRQRAGVGCIEIENWLRAGVQLSLAVRDAYYYSSTARYEDVRDFIWERIKNRHYPTSWRVKRSDFEQQVSILRPRFPPGELDTEDGVYCDLQLRSQNADHVHRTQESQSNRVTRSHTRRVSSRNTRTQPSSHAPRRPGRHGNPARSLPPGGHVARLLHTRRPNRQADNGGELKESSRMIHLSTIR